jgi:hypothetical protein
MLRSTSLNSLSNFDFTYLSQESLLACCHFSSLTYFGALCKSNNAELIGAPLCSGTKTIVLIYSSYYYSGFLSNLSNTGSLPCIIFLLASQILGFVTSFWFYSISLSLLAIDLAVLSSKSFKTCLNVLRLSFLDKVGLNEHSIKS